MKNSLKAKTDTKIPRPRKSPSAAHQNCDEISIETAWDKELIESIGHQLKLLTTRNDGESNVRSPGTSTRIVANVDVGFGNTLYIRGSGCGLSWDRGTEMKSVDGDHWMWECHCHSSCQCFEFKVLINDQIWSSGENYMTIGRANEVKPYF
jgi:hypothetical protein